MYRNTIVVALLIVLTACGGEPQSAAELEADRIRDHIQESKDVVRSMLKNGESARFRNISFNRAELQGQELPFVCGEVNAKNSFGGYGGYQGFISGGVASATFLEEQAAPGEWSEIWAMACH